MSSHTRCYFLLLKGRHVYVVEPILADPRSVVAIGLRNKTLKRFGGVIRYARGQPGAGRIFAHLRDIAPEPGALAQPLTQPIEGLLQVTNVAAAAGILNLGVSAVGFVIMAKKLNRLQRDMNRVLSILDRNHTELLGELAAVKDSLVELRFISLGGQEMLQEAINEVRLVRKDLLDGYLARVITAHAVLRAGRAASAHTVEHALLEFIECRNWLELGLEPPSRDRASSCFYGLTRFRVWCTAVVGEVQARRLSGDLHGAAECSGAAAKRGRTWAAQWLEALMPRTEHGGVHRLEHSGFGALPAETRERLLRLQAGDGADTPPPRERLESALEVVASRDVDLVDWFLAQAALADVLDFIEEATERIESLHEETAFCAERRLTFDRWEALPSQSNAVPLGLIAVGGDQ